MMPSIPRENHRNRVATLSDDIIYYLAENSIGSPSVISRLSLTCRRFSKLLNSLVYQADVLESEQKLGESPEQFRFPYKSGTYNSSYPYPDWDCVGEQQWLLYPLMTAKKISALHWAASQEDKNLALTVARKSIAAALKYWPFYLQVCCGGFGRDMDGMTPLHLAAASGNEEIVEELIRASSIIDARVYIATKFREYTGDPALSETAWSHAIPPMGSFGYHIVVNALGLAILYGHVSVAEKLARVTQDLEDEPWESDADLMSPLKMAVLHKMPSVVRILLSRGYKSNLWDAYFYESEPFQLAAANDGNEEMLQLLMDNAGSNEIVDFHGAFQSAMKNYCKSNILFLSKHCPSIWGPVTFVIFIDTFLRTDEFFPAVKNLLGDNLKRHNLISSDIEQHLLDHVGEALWVGRGIKIQDYLLHDAGITFSEGSLAVLLEDQKMRKEYRERIKTRSTHEQERFAKIEREIFSEENRQQWGH